MDISNVSSITKCDKHSMNNTEMNIRTAYSNYAKTHKEIHLQKLLHCIDAKWKIKVILYLQSKGCLTDDMLDEALCNAWVGVWKTVKNQTFSFNDNPNEFCAYCYGIYMNCAKAVVKQYYRKKNLPNINPLSIDQIFLLGVDGNYQDFPCNNNQELATAPESIVIDLSQTPISDSTDDKQYVYKRLLREYISTLLYVDVSPQKKLAHIYARIIPHLLFEIPDTKASSSKKAILRMKGKKVSDLYSEAEEIIRNELYPDFNFPPDFLNRLNQSTGDNTNALKIKDIIYTDIYGEDKVEHWCDDLHKIIVKETVKRLQRDSSFLKLADKYLKCRNKCCTLIGKNYLKTKSISK